ncbi:MAG: cytidine deaminase [Clostridium sp.]|nr:cytidine deaminase [Acetatifactor muris]MCM1526473.1 cytidine deaminase [Bacteroides sp.]MCM1562401.1 cytidine deaminase [Clostridium sp.]
MTEKEREQLAEEALRARETAYAPYSRYTVGAALLTEDGRIYRGCNVENASFGAANCAERTAIFKAVSEGVRNFKAIAIAGGMEGCQPNDYAYPCGICRQVMQEFCGADFEILVVKNKEDYREYTLSEMLPCGFGGQSIQ